MSLIISGGAGVWIYSKFFAPRGGYGNPKSAIIGSVVVALVLFLILYMTLKSFIK